MKRVRLLLWALVFVMAMALVACNKKGELDIKGLIATETPTPEESKKDEGSATATPEPTKEATATPAPTATPTIEPTATPTATPTLEPTPTEVPEITDEPVPTDDPVPTDEPGGKYASELLDYDTPELLVVGLANTKKNCWSKEDTSKKLYEISYDRLVLNDEEKEKYPELELQFEVLNMTCADAADYWTDLFDSMEDGSYVPDGGYAFVTSNYDIVRADTSVVSLTSSQSSYTGGVHPVTELTGFSIDTQTGEILKVKDICNDCDSLAEMIAYRLEEKYGIWEEETLFNDMISFIQGAIEADSLSFTMGYEGVTFYFPVYSLATYADGNLSVTLSYEEAFAGDTEKGPMLIGYFNKKYRTVPENYMITMTFGEGIEIPELDGETSGYGSLAVCAAPLEDYPFAYDGFYVLINGEEKFRLKDKVLEDCSLNYIKVDDRRFIMLQTVQGSDDIYTYILEIFENGDVGLKDGKDVQEEVSYSYPVKLKDYYGSEAWDYDMTYKNVYDPLKLKIEFRNDIIGTNFLIADARFDADEESFVVVSRYYDFSYRNMLTLKKDFKAGMIDPDLMFDENSGVPGEFDMEVELKAGDAIYLEKTDGYRQVFFSTDSGEWGTFMMDDPDDVGVFYIDGEYVTELFDGVSFAD